jgi:hypothetical protein
MIGLGIAVRNFAAKLSKVTMGTGGAFCFEIHLDILNGLKDRRRFITQKISKSSYSIQFPASKLTAKAKSQHLYL